MNTQDFYAAKISAIRADGKILRRYLDVDDIGNLAWLPRVTEDFPPTSRSWGASRWNEKYAKRPALNCIGPRGYRQGLIFRQNFYAHRAVFALVHGAWPIDHVDHIDGDRLNNAPSNLRSVSQAENNLNIGLNSRNTSGVSGVSFDKKCGRWFAKSRIAGRQKFLGYYDTISAASNAVELARSNAGFHPNHGKARP